MMYLRIHSEFTGNSRDKETCEIKPHKCNHENPDDNKLVRKSQIVFDS